jgi:hypothetical protein
MGGDGETFNIQHSTSNTQIHIVLPYPLPLDMEC